MPRSSTPLAWLLALLAACAPEPKWQGTDVTGVFPELAFSLVGEGGERVSAAEFRGRPVLLFFGFTHCPGPCPDTLARIARAQEMLGPAHAPVPVLLVSVDPERDTPAALAGYTDAFGPWLHGLTGDPAALRALRETYKVHAQRLPAGAAGDYDVAHGTAVLAFDRQGRCRLLHNGATDPAALAADLERLLGEAG